MVFLFMVKETEFCGTGRLYGHGCAGHHGLGNGAGQTCAAGHGRGRRVQ